MTDTNDVTDLWGEIVTEPIRTPLAILREQGAILERRTNGILTVKIVSQSSKSESFSHTFYINASHLNYSYGAFVIHHPIELYPVEVVFDGIDPFGGNRQTASDEHQFLELLKRVLQSDKIQKVISALLSQDIAA
jgi:hypothetical protein